MKTRILFLVFTLYLSWTVNAQKTMVLTLGTFHFDFPNADIEKIEQGNQIDVLDPKYQDEIEDIVARIAKFRPDIIAIEVSPKYQSRTDSLYLEYLKGNHSLGRNECEQIGFRLAKHFDLQKLYCTNDWGLLPDNINNIVYGNDSIENKRFTDFFYNNPDSLIFYEREYVYKTKGILEELRLCNNEDHLRKDLGNYLISMFKYQTEQEPYFGVDFTTGWWFNRNLRIFRNIQMIPSEPGDRILVIYGSGHMNVLNILFEASPEYELEHINNYLK